METQVRSQLIGKEHKGPGLGETSKSFAQAGALIGETTWLRRVIRPSMDPKRWNGQNR